MLIFILKVVIRLNMILLKKEILKNLDRANKIDFVYR